MQYDPDCPWWFAYAYYIRVRKYWIKKQKTYARIIIIIIITKYNILPRSAPGNGDRLILRGDSAPIGGVLYLCGDNGCASARVCTWVGAFLRVRVRLCACARGRPCERLIYDDGPVSYGHVVHAAAVGPWRHHTTAAENKI